MEQRNVLRPSYYSKNKHDLWWFFQKGLLTHEEFIGFIKGNIIKYLIRYRQKNGKEDLQKAKTYLEELMQIEQDENHSEERLKDFCKEVAQDGNEDFIKINPQQSSVKINDEGDDNMQTNKKHRVLKIALTTLVGVGVVALVKKFVED